MGGPAKAKAFLQAKGVGFILKYMDVKFRRPVTYPDTVRPTHSWSHPPHFSRRILTISKTAPDSPQTLSLVFADRIQTPSRGLLVRPVRHCSGIKQHNRMVRLRHA